MIVIVHRYSKKDCYRIFKEILERSYIPSHQVRYSIYKSQITVDGLITIIFKFYSGDEKHMAGIRDAFYNTDSAAASEFLELRGCHRIVDIFEFVEVLNRYI